MEKINLLIDTDIGADVDDIITLYCALQNPKLNLVGITTVFKNTVERARAVNKLQSYFGTNVPVYAGCKNKYSEVAADNAKSTLHDKSADLPQFDPINPNDENGESAVEFIVSQTEKYQSNLVILAIGPLTNVAKAIKIAPDVMRGLNKLVLMGGCYFEGRPEWNIFCDPEGARVVFESGLNIYCVGTDVTKKTKLSSELLQEFLSKQERNDALGMIARHAQKWIDVRNVGVTLHDPLTLYCILYPELIKFKPQRVGIETAGKITKGLTVNFSQTNLYPSTYGETVMVAYEVDEEKAMAIFKELVLTVN